MAFGLNPLPEFFGMANIPCDSPPQRRWARVTPGTWRRGIMAFVPILPLPLPSYQYGHMRLRYCGGGVSTLRMIASHPLAARMGWVTSEGTVWGNPLHPAWRVVGQWVLAAVGGSAHLSLECPEEVCSIQHTTSCSLNDIRNLPHMQDMEHMSPV